MHIIILILCTLNYIYITYKICTYKLDYILQGNYSYSTCTIITSVFSTADTVARDLADIKATITSMHGSMVEFRAEVKGNINSLREDLNALNNSVSNLSVCLQEQKKQSETELADLHTELADLHIALANTANHTRLLNIKMDSLEECLSEHKKQVTGKLNALQTSQANHTSQVEKIQEDVTYLKIIHGPYTCGGTGGWRRAIYLDMTNPNTTCPSGWNMTEYSKRTCGRATDGTNTCDSATFPVRGGEYTRICGRIQAYQWGSPDAFAKYFLAKSNYY